jgi:hypothetical protein
VHGPHLRRDLETRFCFFFLQRSPNGGFAILQEYAEGRGAVDLCAAHNERRYLVEMQLEGAEPLEDCLARLSGFQAVWKRPGKLRVVW